MSWIVVDVEADGPAPGLYSMTQIGAVVLDRELDKTFHGLLLPISDKTIYEPERRKIVENPEIYRPPEEVMRNFTNWLRTNSAGRPMFASDNNGFDWQFVNYYFWAFVGENPFGHSSTNIGSLYKGSVRNMRKNFKHLRKTKHDHNPVNDAMGNAEALLTMNDRFGLGLL